ncbi:MAG TPA: M24 family metallopeptidase [Stellaceae bacterium]|nr:M24 family metallopeptidase [Stellaceae bacterium]
MQVLQTTLLTGPYDWDASLLPRAEFEARLLRVRAALAQAGAGALLVHGHAGDYGALAYLTGFVPKLGPALALVPMEGGIRIIVSGTALMLPQAKLLTWVEDVLPFGNVPKLVGEWLAEQHGATLATWGGPSLAHGLHRGIAASVRPLGAMVALDDALDLVRRQKSPRELDLMRRAGKILAASAAAFTAASRGGAGARTAALAAERAAIAAGAQDVRTLASLRPGGAPLPLDGAEDRVLDPLLAAIAVQHAGYWAAGHVTVANAPGAALARAEAALAAVLREARPGATGDTLLRVAETQLHPLGPHAMMRGAIGRGIGLSLEEGPALSGAVSLAAGATYALLVGAQGAAADAAVQSAVVAITGAGAEILWSSSRMTGGV